VGKSPTRSDVPTAQSAEGTAATDHESWRNIIDTIRREDAALASTLEHAVALEVSPPRIVIGFDQAEGFLARRASTAAAVVTLTRVARAYFGGDTEVVVRQSLAASTALPTIASIDAERKAAEIAAARAAVEEHPLVREAERVFGARIREVKLPSGDG
jgi:DNA polymerase-3 subunit gamma/tau